MSETPDQGDYEAGPPPPPPPPPADDQSGGSSRGEQPDSAPAGDANAGATEAFGQYDPYGQASASGPYDPYGQGAGFGQQATYGQGIPYGQQAAYGSSPYGPPPADLATEPSPVLVSFAPAQKQNRITVLFRWLMVIPAAFVLGFVLIAANAVAFVSWWAALFTGRVPTGMFEFMTGALRWAARLQAYNALLTDQYPPFSLDDDPDYPVRLVTRQTRLSRAAVFFRVILAIPAYIVAIVASLGLTILSFFGWLIALFTGQLPDSLHEAFAAITRYYLRYLGYMLLVTPEYPAGLYGDALGAPAGPVLARSSGTTLGGVFPDEQAQAGAGPAETAQLTGFGAAQTPAAASPWLVTLSSAARTLVTVAIVVGVLGGVADGFLTSHNLGNALNTGNRLAADNSVTNAYNKLGSVLSGFQAKTENCQQNLACVTDLDGQVASAFATFGQTLAGADIPSDFSADAAALTSDNQKVQGDFGQLAAAKSASQYTGIASTLGLQADLTAWQGAFNKLHNELNKP
jgi:Domain of unknown function (DUF4389)